jgi:predicted PurR-regulated permease PerM
MSASQQKQGWLTRERARAIVFVLIAVIVAVLCWLVVEPVFGSLAWATAFAVVFLPVYRWLAKRLKRPSLAAGLTTLLVGIVLVAPTVLIGHQIAQEAVTASQTVKKSIEDDSWQKAVDRNPLVRSTFGWAGVVIDLKEQAARLSEHVPKLVQKLALGSLSIASGTVIALLFLFFFLRDREEVLKTMRGLLPLSPEEDALMFKRIGDTLFAILFGTVVVAGVQGTLGGLMFWILDLPAPALWGCAMAAFAIVPMFGTAVIWLPAVAYLALEGHTGKAAILLAWGVLVISLIDNLLQPMIVEKRLHVHLVLVFISIVGGIYAFGGLGLILGPAILAVAVALLDIWRLRVGQPKLAKESK